MKQDRSQPPATDHAPGLNALDWAVSHGVARQVAGEALMRVRRRRRQRLLAVTTGIAGVVLAGILFRSTPAPPEIPTSIPAAVFAASSARQVLPDGTVVDLKEGSAIEPRLMLEAGADRRVTLLRGEAHFQVAHDPSRPFIVTAGSISVRAIGTAFTVELGRDAIEVVVSEGRVVVERPASRASEQVASAAMAGEVGASERLRSPVAPAAGAAGPRVETLPSTVLADRLSWRIPRIEFSGTPLSEAIPLFNRYGTIQLELADPELGRLQLSGVLRPDSTASLLHLLSVEFGLESESRGANEVVLRRK